VEIERKVMNVWHYVRESGGFKNSTFNSMKKVESCLCNAVNTLLADREKINP
jgi:hypothetical protein